MAFCESFAPYLVSYRHSVLRQAQQYLSGLMQAARATMTRMAEVVPESDSQALQHFLSHSNWDFNVVLREVARRANGLLGGTPDSILVLDETAFAKKGKKSVGVARQWNGCLGKVDNSQVAVFAGLVRGIHGMLVGMRLYLPKSWIEDASRCDQAKIPEQERVEKSKTDLALEIVQDLRDQELDFSWISADAGYGKDPAFLRSLEDSGEMFVIDVHKSQRIFLEDPDPFIPPPSGSRGRPPQHPKTEQSSIKVSAWAQQLSGEDWERLEVRDSTHGLLTVQAACARIWAWDRRELQARCWTLLVTRELDGSKIKYSLSNAPEETTLLRLVTIQRQRYWIERCFQDAKNEAGMDDYQCRTWLGWHRHMTLVLMAMLFMLEMRIEQQDNFPLLTYADIKILLARLLPRRDFSKHELLRQMEARHRARWSAVQSAYRSQGVGPPTLEEWRANLTK